EVSGGNRRAEELAVLGTSDLDRDLLRPRIDPVGEAASRERARDPQQAPSASLPGTQTGVPQVHLEELAPVGGAAIGVLGVDEAIAVVVDAVAADLARGLRWSATLIDADEAAAGRPAVVVRVALGPADAVVAGAGGAVVRDGARMQGRGRRRRRA